MRICMTLDDFRHSLTADKPPVGLTLALAGLWWEAKGDWTRAHESALRCPWRKMVDVSGFLPC
jgi:hypothetical protein